MTSKIMNYLLFLSCSFVISYAAEMEYVTKSLVFHSSVLSPKSRLQQKEKQKNIVLHQLPYETDSHKILVAIPNIKSEREECFAASKSMCSKCAYGITVGAPFVGILGMGCIASGWIPISFKYLAAFGGITLGVPTICLCGQKIYYSCCEKAMQNDSLSEDKKIFT